MRKSIFPKYFLHIIIPEKRMRWLRKTYGKTIPLYAFHNEANILYMCRKEHSKFKHFKNILRFVELQVVKLHKNIEINS